MIRCSLNHASVENSSNFALKVLNCFYWSCLFIFIFLTKKVTTTHLFKMFLIFIDTVHFTSFQKDTCIFNHVLVLFISIAFSKLFKLYGFHLQIHERIQNYQPVFDENNQKKTAIILH